jgi:uncharacterized protein (TIGR02118 family)
MIEHTSMLTRVGAAARRAGLSVQQFQDHWRRQHGPTAGAIPNLRRYVQHHAVLIDGGLVLPYPGFDACSELDFDSIAAMDEGFADAAQRGELRADEDRFVDKARFSWVLGEVDVRVADRVVADPVTLVTWWRAHRSASRDRLSTVLTGAWEAALPEVSGRRIIAARPDWHAGRPPPSADVVDVITFDGLAAARSFLAGEAQAAAPLLAGVAFGSERHLARPVVVR